MRKKFCKSGEKTLAKNILGQTVTVLTDDGFLFVGQIISCDCKFKCDKCDDRTIADFTGLCDGKDKKDDDFPKFLGLQLIEDVEFGGPPGPSGTAFNEGQIVCINFDQIIAIAPGFPPTKKKS